LEKWRASVGGRAARFFVADPDRAQFFLLGRGKVTWRRRSSRWLGRWPVQTRGLLPLAVTERSKQWALSRVDNPSHPAFPVDPSTTGPTHLPSHLDSSRCSVQTVRPPSSDGRGQRGRCEGCGAEERVVFSCRGANGTNTSLPALTFFGILYEPVVAFDAGVIPSILIMVEESALGMGSDALDPPRWTKPPGKKGKGGRLK